MGDMMQQVTYTVGSVVSEVKGSHAIYVSQPAAVAAIIEKAAKAGTTNNETTSSRRPGSA